MPLKILLLVCFTPVFFSFSAQSYALDSAQDGDISVYPVIHSFPETAFGNESTPVLFTITNESSGPLTISEVNLVGTNVNQFRLVSTDCVGALPDIGDTCVAEVSYKPTKRGTVSARLEILSDDSETPVLAAFVSNNEAIINQAQRRMPPVLVSATIPDTMVAGTTYELSWELEGYHSGYLAYAALFDCTGLSQGNCGNDYNSAEMFAESDWFPVDPAGTPGTWTYQTKTTRRYQYTWSFTVPLTRENGEDWAVDPGTDIVVRFYTKSDLDSALGKKTVSLLIPGNKDESHSFYDSEGRRLVKKIKWQ